MIPVELELRNFLAYREPGPLRLDGVRVACLAGPNGAGKSTLLDAITWALWGRARSNAPDELIHQGQSEMRVALTFDLEAARYRVIRQRKAGKRGASLLEFQTWDSDAQGWRGLAEGSMRKTQERIEALLRLDYETFVNSAFLVQGRADEFTTKTPSQRKQVLANILGLWRWEVYEERARERQVRAREALQRLEGGLQEIERELAQGEAHAQSLAQAQQAAGVAAAALEMAERQWADLEQVRARAVTLQREIDDLSRRIRAREAEIAEGERERQALLAQSDSAALEAALEGARQAAAALEPLQAELEHGRGRALELAQQAAGLRGENQALGPQAEPIKERQRILKGAAEPACPTCGQPLTEEHRGRLLEELRQDLESRRARYRANQTRIKALEEEVTTLEARLTGLAVQVRERPALEKRIGELEAARAHAGQAAAQAQALEAKLGRWRQDCAQDADRRAALEQEAEANDQRLRAAALRQEDLDRLRLEKRMADERVGGARQRLAALQSFARQRQQRLEQRAREAADLALYDDLRTAFGKRGVPAMIIETVIPELESSANELLNRMSEGRLHVRIETQKETKTGELREALDIFIADELGTRPYELYSGGEAFRINFAIRIALSRLLARRAGAQLRSLFIDEGFGTQDARGREHLVSAINSIQDDFDRILVITHIDELKEAFPARIEVRRGPDGSTFALA